MKLIALTLTTLLSSLGGLTACGGGGCDALADCNSALRDAGFTTITEISGFDEFCDAQLEEYRNNRSSIEEATGGQFPSECQ